jgi:hypothetical protein
MPEFKERDEKKRSEKAARLAPAINAAMARRVEEAPPMPEGYVMDALAKQVVKQMGGDLDEMAKKMAVGEEMQDMISNDVREELA